MKTALIVNAPQFFQVCKAWNDSDVKPMTMAGHKFELTLKARKDSKTRLQEEKYHAMITDISKQCTLYGKTLPPLSWKRLLVDAFKHETKDDAEYAADWAKFGDIELLPALNHAGFVMVGEQTRNFSLKLAMGFITFLLAYGVDQHVKWTASKRDQQLYGEQR